MRKNRRGVVSERTLIGIVLLAGLLGIGVMLWATGIVSFAPQHGVTGSAVASITGLAADDVETQPSFTATPAPNTAPIYRGPAGFSTPQDTPLTLDLSQYFSDAENDELTFIASSEDVIAVAIDGNALTLTPAAGFAGERSLTVIASDGVNLVRTPVKVIVEGAVAPAEPAAPVPSAPQPEPSQVVQNETQPPAENATAPEQNASSTSDYTNPGSFTGQATCNSCSGCTTCMATNGNTCVLTADINFTTNICVTINANHTVLDCAGFTIRHGFAAVGSQGSIGIRVSNLVPAVPITNITVQNCIIRDVNGTDTLALGIRVNNTVNATFLNNTIYLNGTGSNYGIFFEGSPILNNVIANNTILNLGGGGSVVTAVFIGNNITGNTIYLNASSGAALEEPGGAFIFNNTIITNGSSGLGSGIAIGSTSASANAERIIGNFMMGTVNVYNGVLVANNTINISATGGAGITIGGGVSATQNNLIVNNTVIVNGTTAKGISLTGASISVTVPSNNTIDNNTIIVTGTLFGGSALEISAPRSASFVGGNNITATGANTVALRLSDANFTVLTNTRILNPDAWLLATTSTGFGGNENNFTNTTFETPDGSTRFPNQFQVNGSQNVTRARLNISFNRVSINSTNLTFLNTSAQITFENVNFDNNSLLADFRDSGMFTRCPDTVCTFVSSTDTEYVFNVTRFTSFSSGGLAIELTKTDNPDPVRVNSILNYTVLINVTVGNASNITLTDLYPNEVIFQSAQPSPLAGTNDTFIIGNLTENQSFTVNITVLTASLTANALVNNTANISFQNATGTLLAFNTTESTTVAVFGVPLVNLSGCATINLSSRLTQSVSAAGTCITFGNSSIILDCAGFNITFGTGGGSANGINANNRSNITVISCTVQDTNAGAAFGIGINFTRVNNSVIVNTTVKTNGTTDNYGILVTLNSSNNTIVNSTIRAMGTGASNFGIYLFTNASNNLITNSTIFTNGTTNNYGVYVQTFSVNNTIVNNTVVADGTSSTTTGGIRIENAANGNIVSTNAVTVGTAAASSNFGIYLFTGVSWNTVSGNTVVARGTSTIRGIFLDTGAQNNTVANNIISVPASSSTVRGIEASTTVRNNTIVNNTMNVSGTTAVHGIVISTTAVNNTVANNTIRVNASSVSNFGIYLVTTAQENNVTGNTVTVNATTTNAGIRLESTVNNNTLSNNNIRVSGTGADNNGIQLLTSAFSNRIENSTIFTNGTATNYGIVITTSSDNITILNNSINTTGGDSYGIRMDNVQGMTLANNSITTGTDGLFIEGTQPIHFSTQSISTDNLINGSPIYYYGGAGASPLCPNNTVLNAPNASHIDFLFCGNITLTNFSDFDVLTIVNSSNITVNYTKLFNNKYGVRIFFGARDNTIIGNNITANTSTFTDDYGIWLQGFVFNNTIANNNITTMGTGANNYGVYLFGNATNNVIAHNQVNTSGTSSNNGIRVESTSHNDTVLNNTVNAKGSSSSNHGIVYFNSINGGTAVNNTIITNGTLTNVGIYIITFAQNITAANNSVVADATSTTSNGIRIESAANANMVANNSVVVGSGVVSTNVGIYLFTGVSWNTVIGNTIVTKGTTSIRGIFLDTGAQNNTIANNIISVPASSSTVRGIEASTTVRNNTIVNNTMNVSGTASVFGITVNTNAFNNTVINNTIIVNASSTPTYGIYLVTTVQENNVTGNAVTVNGTTANTGLRLESAVNNNTFANNSFRVSGTGADINGLQIITNSLGNRVENSTFILNGTTTSYGVVIQTGSDNNTVINNTISTRGIDSYGVRMDNIQGTTLINNTINGTSDALFIEGITMLQFTTHRISADNLFNGSPILYYGAAGASPGCPNNTIQSMLNASHVDFIGCSNVTLTNFTDFDVLTLVNSRNITVSYSSILGGKYGVRILVNGSGNTIAFNNITANTTTFTDNYGIWLQQYELNNVINNNNIFGNNITTMGAGATNNGIELFNASNNTIANNYVNTSGTSANQGIRMESMANNNSVINNTINTKGSSSSNHGIVFFNTVNGGSAIGNTIITNGTTVNIGIYIITFAQNITVANNSVVADATSTTNNAIRLENAANANTVSNNTVVVGTGAIASNSGIYLLTGESWNSMIGNSIVARGTSSIRGIFLDTGSQNNTIANNIITVPAASSTVRGIEVTGTVRNNTIVNNTVNVSGTTLVFGITVNTNAFNNTIANNTVRVNASSSSVAGIYLVTTVIDNNITGNTIFANGTTTVNGIRVESTASNNTFDNNNITASGTNAYAIEILTTSSGNKFNRTVLSNPVQWIQVGAGSVNENFTNTTFVMPNGSIAIFGSFNLTGAREIAKSKLNISANKAFLNSTNASFLNQSGEVQLFNVVAGEPRPTFDSADTGVFVDCPATQCTLKTYAGNVLTFNVSSFTTYSWADGGLNLSLTKTDSPDPVALGTTLAYTISFMVSSGNASNVTVTDTYPNQAIFLTAQPTPEPGTNNTFILGNLTNGTTVVINITMQVLNTVSITGVVINNTANASFQNQTGQTLTVNVTTNTTVLSLPVIAQVILNSTNPLTNDTEQNLTMFIINVTDPENNSVQNITDWRINGTSIAVFNTPFENATTNISAGSIRDYSTFGNNGTLGDGTQSQAPNWTARGQVGGAYLFDGVNDVIRKTSPVGLTFNNTNEVTAMAWINVTPSAFDFWLTMNNGLGGFPYRFGSSSGTLYWNMAGAGDQSFSGFTFNAGQWYHVAFVGKRNGSTIYTYIYINGTVVTSVNTGVATAPAITGNILVGTGENIGTHPFNGMIDELQVFRRALSDEEINFSFQAGLNRTRTTLMSRNDTLAGDTWSACATPNDNQSDGTQQCSNNVTIQVVPQINISNITVVKTDAPDPVGVGSNLSYIITVASTGNLNASNVTVNDTYPNEVIFLTAQPTPLAGTNNTWILGNLTQNTTITINITVFVQNLLASAVINNTVNATFQNDTGDLQSRIATASTTVHARPTLINITACPATLNTTGNVTQNIASSGNCITITADNLPLECNGFTITGSNTGFGVNATNRQNITIRNCNLQNFSTDIRFQGTNNSVIANTTALNPASESIILNASNNNTLSNVTLATAAAVGVSSTARFDNNQRVNINDVSTEQVNTTVSGVNGALSQVRVSLHLNHTFDGDVRLFITSPDSTTVSLSINNGASGQNYGSDCASDATRTVFDQYAATSITAGSPPYVGTFQPQSSFLAFENKTGSAVNGVWNLTVMDTAGGDTGVIGCWSLMFNASGSSTGSGMVFQFGSNNTVANSNITRNLNPAVSLVSSRNNTFTNTTLGTAGTWLSADAASTNNTLNNVTFESANGSIGIPSTVVVANDSSAMLSTLNISFNQAFLNSSNLSFLNTSGVIELRNLSFTNPFPTVDFEDDGTFADCPGSVCTASSFSGATLRYNVAHFTAYSSSQSGVNYTIAKTDSPDSVEPGGTLSYTVTFSIVGGNASNLTLTDIYPPQVIFQTAQPSPFAGTNNTFILGNITSGQTVAVNITTLVLNGTNGTVINNTANISFQNNTGGVVTASVTENTTVLLFVISGCPITINASATLSQNLASNGTCVTFGASNIALDCAGNTITYNALGQNNAVGVLAANKAGVAVRNCVIRDINTSGASGFGLSLAGVNDSQFVNNTVFTNGTSNSDGFRFFNRGRNNSVANNTIVTQGSLDSNRGIDFFGNISGSAITGNTVMTNGTAPNEGILLFSGSNNNTVANNTVRTNGDGGSNYGIYILTSISGTTVANNTIFTNGTGAGNTGIVLEGNVGNNTVTNNTVSTNGNANDNEGIFLTTNAGQNNVTHNRITTNGTFNSDCIELSNANGNLLADNIMVSGGTSNVNDGFYFPASSSNNTFINNVINTTGTNNNLGFRLFSNSNGNRIVNNTINTGGSESYNEGVHIEFASDNLVANNTINTRGGDIFTTAGNTGVIILASGNTTVLNNRISTGGKASDNHGIWVLQISENNTIANNTILTNGTHDNYGIFVFDNSNNNLVANNTVLTRGNESRNIGVFMNGSSTNNTVIGISILTNGSSDNHGVRVDTAANGNRFTFANISTNGAASYGIFVNGSNNTVFDTTLLNNTVAWLNLSGSTLTNFSNITFDQPNGSITLNNVTRVTIALDITKAKLNVTFNNAFLNSTNLTVFNSTALIQLRSLAFNNPRPTVDAEDDGTFINCPAAQCVKLSYVDSTLLFNVSQFTSYSSTEAGGIGSCPITINQSTTLDQSLATTGTCITINNASVTLDCANFTITYGNAGNNDSMGVNVTNSTNATVVNCNIVKGSANGLRTYGIGVVTSPGMRAENNTIRTNGTGNDDGIHISRADGTNPGGTVRLVTNPNNIYAPSCVPTAPGVSYCSVAYVNDFVDGGTIFPVGSRRGGCQVKKKGYHFNTVLQFNLSVRPTGGAMAAIGGEFGGCALNGVELWHVYVNNNCRQYKSVRFNSTPFVVGENNLTCYMTGIGAGRWRGFGLDAFSYDLPPSNTTGTASVIIKRNSIVASAGNDSNGIFLDADNSSLINNTILALGDNLGDGIETLGANAIIAGNTIGTRAINQSHALFLSGGNSTIIANNTLNASTDGSAALYMGGSATNATVQNNTVFANGTGTNGIYLSSSTGHRFVNNTFLNTSGAAVFAELSLDNVFSASIIPARPITSLLILESDGFINYTQQLNITSAALNLSQVVNISYNSTFVNTASAAGSQLNASALLSFFSILDLDAFAVVDANDSGSFATCPSPRCANGNFDPGNSVMNYNVQSFTTYATKPVQACGVLDYVAENDTSLNITLTRNVTSNDTCFQIFASNTTLDCQGNIIFYDAAGGGNDAGVAVGNATNVTIQNCIIRDINAGGAYGHGISLLNISSAFILNNTIKTNGTHDNYGVSITGQINRYDVIENNTIATRGTSSSNYGISFNESGSDANSTFRDSNITGNTITTMGTSLNIGIEGERNTSDIRIANNSIRTNGSSFGNDGIALRIIGANHTNYTIVANNITTNGSGGGHNGLELINFYFGRIENNTIDTGNRDVAFDGGSSFGIDASGFSSNVIAGNTIRTGPNMTLPVSASSSNFGMDLGSGSDNLVTRNLIVTSGSDDEFGILLGANSNNVLISNNEIRACCGDDNFGIDGGTGTNLSIVNNTILLADTDDNFGIILTGLGANYTLIANNTINTCCTDDNFAIIITAFGGLIINNTIQTCCTFSNYGILATSASHLQIMNNSIKTGSTDDDNEGIVLSGTNLTVMGNNISTNGTLYNPGISITAGNSTVAYNTIRAIGRTDSNIGIDSGGGSTIAISNNNIHHNNITTNGTFSNIGITMIPSALPSGNNSITDNRISTNGNNISNDGIDMHTDNSTAAFNVIFTNGSSSNFGIDIVADANVTGNNITTSGTAGENFGIRMADTVLDTIITNNRISTNGSNNNHGIFLFDNASENRFSDNNITALGIDSDGIYIVGTTLGNYSFNDSFEDGNLSPFVTFGNSSWIINNTNTSTGNFSAQAGNLSVSGQQSTLALNLTVPIGTYTFQFAAMTKLNSSGFTDSLQVSTDGSLRTSITGITNWSYYNYSLSEGNHTIQWTFAKSFTGSQPSTAFIDDVALLPTAPSSNNSFTNTILQNPVAWMYLGNGSVNNTFTNTLFDEPNGSIRVLPTVVPNGEFNITKRRLNISFNRAFLNSSNVSFLNASGQVTFRGITFANPAATVDDTDDETFAFCTAPRCTGLTFSGGTLIYNVSGFTTYSSTDAGGTIVVLSKSDSPDPVNASSQLNYTIVINVTLGNASNITLTDLYPNQVVFLSSQPSPLAGTNNTFIIGNFSNGTAIAVNVSVFVLNVTNGTIINNTANITFQNGTGAVIPLNVTESTTVLAPVIVQFNLSNVSLIKLDSPDPVNASGNLSYTILVNATADSPQNVTLTDLYPNEVIFLTAQPSPISGTNNTFIVGNLTANQTFIVNITVLVRNVTNGTVINNTANISFTNQTGGRLTVNASASTMVLNPPRLNTSSITITKTDSPDPVENGTQLNYTIVVNVTGNGTSFNVSVNDTYPNEVVFLTAQPAPLAGTNNTFILGNLTPGTVIRINITVNVTQVVNGTVINNSVATLFQNETSGQFVRFATANTTVQNVSPTPAPSGPTGTGGGYRTPTIGGVIPAQPTPPAPVTQPVVQSPQACIENWVCDGWSSCANGEMTRTCTDQSACGTARFKPVAARGCAEEQQTAPVQAEAPAAEQPAVLPTVAGASQAVAQRLHAISALPWKWIIIGFIVLGVLVTLGFSYPRGRSDEPPEMPKPVIEIRAPPRREAPKVKAPVVVPPAPKLAPLPKVVPAKMGHEQLHETEQQAKQRIKELNKRLKTLERSFRRR